MSGWTRQPTDSNLTSAQVNKKTPCFFTERSLFRLGRGWHKMKACFQSALGTLSRIASWGAQGNIREQTPANTRNDSPSTKLPETKSRALCKSTIKHQAKTHRSHQPEGSKKKCRWWKKCSSQNGLRLCKWQKQNLWSPGGYQLWDSVKADINFRTRL